MRKESSHINSGFFFSGIKNHSKLRKKKQPKGCRVHLPDNKSNVSNMLCSTHHLLTVPVNFRYSLTPCLVRTPPHTSTTAKPSRSSIQRVLLAPPPGSGRPVEKETARRRKGDPGLSCLQLALARSCALLPVTAWKPVLMLATEQREWHVSHCRKYRRVSFCRMVSGERQV